MMERPILCVFCGTWVSKQVAIAGPLVLSCASAECRTQLVSGLMSEKYDVVIQSIGRPISWLGILGANG